MPDRKTDNVEQSQIDKFKQAARELETDDDEALFDEKMRKLMRQKPANEKSRMKGG